MSEAQTETVSELQLVELQQPQAALPVAQPPSVPAVATPGDLLRIAMNTASPDLDRLERLMEMQERHERREAEKAYADAMATFKANPPTIGKNKKADFTTAKGRTTYDFSDLGNVVAQIVPALAAHGFAHRWSLTQDGKRVTVTCTITHRQGHSEQVTMSADNDETGGKNSIQAIGSAKSYLERYTLLAATGLAVSDGSDDDGASTDLKTELADEWIAKVKAAPTDKDVLKVWELGSAALEKLPNSYKEFKDAVATRRGEIQEGAQK